MADGRHNMKNPAVKRILQEVKEMQSNPSDDYMSLPLEDNIFEWQFAIRGPKDSEFEGGIYHGRIQLPPEYPFKPPSFMLLTPNGRFETQTKICLSISQYHPEHWQPSWSVRTALVALIAFMPTKPDGAIGSLDYTKEERRALAIKSRGEAPKFGNEERQKLIDEVHSYMVQKSPPVPELPVGNADTTSDSTSQGALQKVEKCPSVEELVADNVQGPENSSIMDGDDDEAVQNTFEVPVNADAGSVVVDHVDRQATDVASNRIILPAQMTPNPQTPARTGGIQEQADDCGLTLLAVGLTMALIALLVKKFMKSYWWFDAGSI